MASHRQRPATRPVRARRPLPGWRALLALASAPLTGCVALHHASVEYVDVQVPYVTRAEVLALFGEPKRTSFDAGTETWYYRFLAHGLTDRAVLETFHGGGFLMPRSYTTTTHEENVRISFSGDTVVKAQELVSREAGFGCGIFLAHGIQPRCGSYSKNRDEPAVRIAGARPVTTEKAVSFSRYCAAPPVRNAQAATCLAYQSIPDDWPKMAQFDVTTQDFGTSYLVSFTRPGHAEQGSRSFRVMVATGAVQAVVASQP